MNEGNDRGLELEIPIIMRFANDAGASMVIDPLPFTRRLHWTGRHCLAICHWQLLEEEDDDDGYVPEFVCILPRDV